MHPSTALATRASHHMHTTSHEGSSASSTDGCHDVFDVHLSHPPFLYFIQGFRRPPTSSTCHGSHGRFFSHFFCHLFGRRLGHFGSFFFAARLATVLATFPAAFAAMRPSNFDASRENIPEPRCPLLGKIPRRLGSIALISVFICRGVSLPPICFSPVSLRSELSARSCTSSAHTKPAPNCGKE